jgi:hypothetical protein
MRLVSHFLPKFGERPSIEATDTSLIGAAFPWGTANYVLDPLSTDSGGIVTSESVDFVAKAGSRLLILMRNGLSQFVLKLHERGTDGRWFSSRK